MKDEGGDRSQSLVGELAICTPRVADILASLTLTRQDDWSVDYLLGMDAAVNRWPRKPRST